MGGAWWVFYSDLMSESRWGYWGGTYASNLRSGSLRFVGGNSFESVVMVHDNIGICSSILDALIGCYYLPSFFIGVFF